MKKILAERRTLILLIALASFSFAWIYYTPDSPFKIASTYSEKNNINIDEKAKKLMLEMSNTLKSIQQFKFTSKGYFELVDSLGKKEKMHNFGQLMVKRPDKIKVMRTGEKSDIEFYCDGNNITLYGKKTNFYARSEAAPTLDETFDKIRETLNIELPATDLLYTDVYDGLMQDIVSGKYVGKETVGSVPCHHLSFTGKEVDWEIWIDDGSKKLPRKYTIISKDIQGKPISTIEITEWDTDVVFNDQVFQFVPPKGAVEIDFLKTNKEDSQTKK